MFSKTTMELSTSIPMASARPAMEMMFRVTSLACITEKVPRMDSGMLMRAMELPRQLRRKARSTAPVKSSASSAVLERLEMARVMGRPWSKRGSMLTPSGRRCLSMSRAV